MKSVTKKKKIFKPGNFVMDFVIYTLLIGLTIVTFYPIWYVIVASFSTSTDIAMHGSIMLWPSKFDFGAYKMVFKDKDILNGFKNSVVVLIGSLPINIIMTLLCGYFLSCTGMLWKKLVVGYIMFTMFFNGGLIPNYLNIKDLRIYDTIWALIIPGAVTVTNAIICKTSIEAIPESLKESAYLDGATDFQIIVKIIVPLIKATLAVLTLYYGVNHWNAWFNASIYLKGDELLPVQNVLREILLANSEAEQMGSHEFNAYAETIKYAAIVVSSLPIMCIYPFLQKYFTKGALIGAVKG
ncbi:MAG: carbohydrate ABC transporter permease [Lachnospiraceae bacterium]|nr:carbohydrate ABC transporter permease [Lachnospiraceae bacterium]